MKNLISMTGIDGTKLLMDVDQFAFAQEVTLPGDHHHTEIYLNLKTEKGIPLLIKVNDPLDLIKEKVYGNIYGTLGGKL